MNSSLYRNTNFESLAHAANYSPVAVAALHGISLRQFERLCLATRGEAPKKLLHDLRMKRAAILLPGKSVKETAFELGYSDLSHFVRHFKQYYGVPPGCWAKQAKPGNSIAVTNELNGERQLTFRMFGIGGVFSIISDLIPCWSCWVFC